MIRLRTGCGIVVALFVVITLTTELCAQRGANWGRSATAGLSRWGDRPSTLPSYPVRPIHPIHPIRPWPWWGTNVVVYNPYPWGVGNYFYPPTRWDVPAWDGQVRDTTPPPAPRQPREPQRPLVMEWNAAKGRAESVHLDRWDGVETTPTQPAPPPAGNTTPPATSDLKRWDS